MRTARLVPILLGIAFAIPLGPSTAAAPAGTPRPGIAMAPAGQGEAPGQGGAPAHGEASGHGEAHEEAAGAGHEGGHGGEAAEDEAGIRLELDTFFDWMGIHVNHVWMPVIMSAIVGVLFLLLVAILGRNLQKVPGRGQALLEFAVEGLAKFCEDTIGHGGTKYVPFVGTVFLYIWFMNLTGLIPGFHAPTSRIETTVSLAIVVFVVVQIVGVRNRGLGYLKHFLGEPLWLAPLMFPIHVVGEFVKPVSLSLRLFGNIFGEDTLIAAIISLSALTFVPWQLPLLLLSLLMGLIQALIFSVLTCIYLKFALEEGH